MAVIGASWLAEYSLTPNPSLVTIYMFNRLKKLAWQWRGLLLTVPSLTLVITLLRLSGSLQPLSWWSYDLLFKLRPAESPDERIIIVSLEEADIQKYRQWPVNDRLLAQLLRRIKAQQPTVIGLNIHRDIPVPPGYQELVAVFQTTPNLIGIEKVSRDRFYPSIAPPPLLKQLGQVSASDLVVDQDGVLRRGILYPRTNDEPALPSLGLAVALEYLQAEGIYPQTSAEGRWLQLGETIFPPLASHDGGYVEAGTAEYQILLNFRGAAATFPTVSFSQVLENQFPPDLFTNKIVLIGSRALSLKDYFYTPYSKGSSSSPILSYGVEIQAHLASQIISTVLDGRELIKVWSESRENLWTFWWILLPAVWGWYWRCHPNPVQLFWLIGGGTIGFSALLIGSVYLAFLQAWWIPLIPPLLGLWASTIIISGIIYISQLQEAKVGLESQVAQRTRELNQQKQKLEQTLQQLQATQEQIIAQERLAYLGFLSAGITHEIRNPVNLIKSFTDLSRQLEAELRTQLAPYAEILTAEDYLNFQENLSLISENLQTINHQTQRIELIIKTLLPIAGFQQLSPALANINDLLETASKLVYYSRKVTQTPVNLSLETNYDDSVEEIEVIAPELTQALVNLIDNAYDALSQKQLLSGEDYIAKIVLTSKNLPEAISISIFDNGMGIAPELQSQIFQPFVTTKPSGTGTGLGLSLARDIILGKHGGNLTLETETGSYTKFTIILPKHHR